MIREKDKVSIIVPVYNVEKYLNRCVESIIKQIYDKLQIILVDDGSTDQSGAICDTLAKKDERIIVFHKNWGGLADTRNVGLAFATGEYISFIDSDDYIEETMFQEMVFSMKKYDCEIGICGRFDVLEGSKVFRKNYCLKERKVYETSEVLKEYLKNSSIEASSCCDKIFHYSVIEDLYFPRGKVSEDVYFTYKAFQKARSVVHIGKPMYYYCHRKGSLSTKIPMDKTEFDLIKFLKLAEKQLWINGNKFLIKQFYAFYLSTLLVIYEETEKSIKADRSFYKYKFQLKGNAIMRVIFVLCNSCISPDKKWSYLKLLFA